ncbi:phage portal protein [Sphingopyxis sp. C-1]|nr:phage portal protein [Sphingopyxis sp. C-1]
MKYYDGDPFGDEVEGLSQIVLPDVAETCDYMTISVLRTFVSGDRVVEFQAKRPEEEEAVDQATESIHQIFMQHQDGYRVLHDWLKAGLIEIIGVVKSCVVEEDAVEEQVFNATEEELVAAMERGEVPEDADIAPSEDGMLRIVVKQTIKRRYFYDYTVPSEEYRFSARARHEDKADYQAHVCRKTRSDLVEMGFDVDTVYELSTGDDTIWSDGRAQERDEDYDRGWSDTRQASMQELELWEEYIRIDADGDGVAELLKCFRVGDQLLSSEIVSDHPFTVFCPFPRPHRMVGDSLAEKAMDIQRIRSVVARQLMNGMYLTNMPRYWLPQESTTENTIADLLTIIPGAPVRGKGTAPQPLNDGFDIGQSLGVLEFWSGEKESRTGITRMNQGLDADTLNKTATGTALMQAQGQQYEEFIARNFAECVGRMFWRKYRLVKDAGEPFTVKVGGAYATVDPTQWPDEPDMVIRTGLGTNRKEYRIAQRMQLLEVQKEASMIGLASKKKLFNGAAGIVRDMGIGQPDDFFDDPDTNPQAEQEQPDPEVMKAQMQADAQKAKIEGEQQLSAVKLEIQREEAAQKQQLAREEAEFEAQLATEKFQFEQDQARARMMFEAQMAREKAETDAAARVEISQNRPGGDLDK